MQTFVTGGRRLLLGLAVIVGTPVVIILALLLLGSGIYGDLTDGNIPGVVRDVKGISTRAKAPAPLGGVSVCENAYAGPFTGYPLHCETDIGTAPIRPPTRMWCITTLTGVKDKSILVQVFHGATLVENASGELFGQHAKTTAYAEIVPADVDVGRTRGRLPAGRYRGRFSADGEVHARTFRVA